MSAEHPAGPRGRLWYLTLELPIEGHASHTHMAGILRGLLARGWSTQRWHPSTRHIVRGPVRRLFEMLVTQARLVVRTNRPDVLYVRGHFGSLPAVLWASLQRVPVVWELNGPPTDVLSSWPQARRWMPLIGLAVRWQLRRSATVIAVTPELGRWAADHGARSTHVVTNGADTELFNPTSPSTLELPPRFVCFAGALATWQGLADLLDAAALPTWPAGVSLVVIGDGALADVVRSKSTDNPRIVYLGRMAQADVSGVLARSLAAVAPKSARDHGRTGVVPLKLFEAMACGVPIIVTDLPGQSDIVTSEECGLVIPPDDASAIARAVATLAAAPDEARAMGHRGRLAAVTTYSWDAAAAKTDDILRGITSR